MRFMSLLFFLLTLSVSSLCSAAAWVLPTDQTQITVKSLYNFSDNYINANGRSSTSPWGEVTIRETIFTVEKGLSTKDTFVMNIPYSNVYTSKYYTPLGVNIGPRRSTGIGNIDIGLRHGIQTKGATVTAWQVLAGIPTYDRQLHPALNFGSTYIDASYLAGHVFAVNGLRGYTNLEAGFRFKGDGMADQFRYSYQYYHPMSKNWGLNTGLGGAYSLNGSYTKDADWRYDVMRIGFGPSIRSTNGKEEFRLIAYKDIFAHRFFKWEITELTYTKKF
ncbi:MAG: hypothetical protein H6Q68_1240 [Firmicutes bacterium]|nr:hypothetical protein [Bacillota bacterium]